MALRSVIKIAKPGRSVDEDTRYLNIDSSKNQLKVFLQGEGTANIVKGSGLGTVKDYVEITHDIGYQPLIRVWFGVDGEWSERFKFIDVDVGDPISDLGVGCGVSRPNENTLVIWFYTVDIFIEDYDIDVDYKYIIYIDPYKDAWS